MSNENESGIGMLSGICIVVNLLMGSGYLALPNGFYEGGVIASTAMLLGVLGVMVITCLWESKCVVKAARILNSSKIPEVAEAMRVYCGDFWRNMYISGAPFLICTTYSSTYITNMNSCIVLALSLGSSSWVFAVLFAQTASASVPIYHPDVVCQSGIGASDPVCNTRYLLNILVFGLITTPLALMDVKEQAIIQNSLAVMRVLRCVLMICTPLMAVSQLELERGFPFATSGAVTQTPVVAGSLDGVFIVLSVCVFSFFLNSSVPIFIDALRNVKNALTILVWGFFITAGLYWVLAVVGSVSFGSGVSSTCNLAWHGFRWPFVEHCPPGSVCDITSRIVECIVVFSPVLDVISVYPLGTIVLANSAWEVVFGVPHHEFPGSVDQILVHHYIPVSRLAEQTSNATENTPLVGDAAIEPPRWYEAGRGAAVLKKLVRFMLNVLPLIAAALMQNFLQIVSFAGSISVLICLVFPAFLSLRCSSYEEKHKVAERTVTAHNHLDWCDKPLHTLFPENFKTERLEVGLEHAETKEVVLDHDDPEDSFIEQRWFKLAIIWLGFAVTGIIFYSSVMPVPTN